MKRLTTKHFLSFLAIIVTALFAIIIGSSYRIGSLSNMGPGFFPVAIGVLMATVGFLHLLSKDSTEKEQEDEADGHIVSNKEYADKKEKIIRSFIPFLLIFISVIIFIYAGRKFGLVIGTFSLCFISSFADKENSFKSSLILSIALTLLCVVIFKWFLRIPFPLFGSL